MSVLLVNMSIDRRTGGGTATRTLELAKSLNSDYSVNCIILSTDQGLDKSTINYHKKLNNVILPCLVNRFYIPYFSWRKLKKVISRVEIIHLMSHWTIINVLVYIIAVRLKKPYTFCPAGTLHIFGRSEILKRFYNFIIGAKIIKNASKCIAITELEKKDFLPFGINPDSIEVIPNGIDEKEFYPNHILKNSFKEKYKLDSSPYLLFMGRLNIIKGPDILVDAFIKLSKIFPNLHLVIAGPDEGLEKEITHTINTNFLESRVHLLGYVDSQYKIGAYTGAEILVVPSRREAMSIVAIEAGACGTPVLLTNNCGFDEVKKVGCSVVDPNVEELFKGLYNMINANNLEIIGKDLRGFVLNSYTWAITAKKYLEL